MVTWNRERRRRREGRGINGEGSGDNRMWGTSVVK